MSGYEKSSESSPLTFSEASALDSIPDREPPAREKNAAAGPAPEAFTNEDCFMNAIGASVAVGKPPPKGGEYRTPVG
jgi:hypothetical protein